MPIKRPCEDTECPVEAALDLIGGKWKTMIIVLLMSGTLRFNELQRRLKGVIHRVQSLQLGDLEETGISTSIGGARYRVTSAFRVALIDDDRVAAAAGTIDGRRRERVIVSTSNNCG